MDAKCPVCNQSNYEFVFSSSSTAVHRLKHFSNKEEAQKAPSGKMNYLYCKHCGAMWNASFDPNLIKYDSDYTLERGCSPFFLNHLEEMGDFVSSVLDPDDAVIELGCGNGDFLKILEKRGINNLKGYDTTYKGCDPRIKRQYLDINDYSDSTTKVYALRHVIEHIHKPYEFLESLKSASPHAWLFIETPLLEFIFDTVSFSDFYYEHCTYFSISTFKELFSEIQIRPCFNGQYICLMAKLNSLKPRDLLLRCAKSGFTVPDFNGSRQLVKNFLETEKNLIVWGAGQNGIGFIEFSDPEMRYISHMVDINPLLHNQFVATTGIQILDPERLNDRSLFKGDETILVNNANYLNEVQHYLARIDWKGKVVSIDEIMGLVRSR
jgi:SAM-dependent methyltransferase